MRYLSQVFFTCIREKDYLPLYKDCLQTLPYIPIYNSVCVCVCVCVCDLSANRKQGDIKCGLGHQGNVSSLGFGKIENRNT